MSDAKQGRDPALEAQADAVLKPDTAAALAAPQRVQEWREEAESLRGSGVLPGGRGVVVLRIPVENSVTPTAAVVEAQNEILMHGLRDWLYVVENEVGDTFVVRGNGEELTQEELLREQG